MASMPTFAGNASSSARRTDPLQPEPAVVDVTGMQSWKAVRRKPAEERGVVRSWAVSMDVAMRSLGVQVWRAAFLGGFGAARTVTRRVANRIVANFMMELEMGGGSTKCVADWEWMSVYSLW